jgi:hypothetical protein
MEIPKFTWEINVLNILPYKNIQVLNCATRNHSIKAANFKALVLGKFERVHPANEGLCSSQSFKQRGNYASQM